MRIHFFVVCHLFHLTCSGISLLPYDHTLSTSNCKEGLLAGKDKLVIMGTATKIYRSYPIHIFYNAGSGPKPICTIQCPPVSTENKMCYCTWEDSNTFNFIINVTVTEKIMNATIFGKLGTDVSDPQEMYRGVKLPSIYSKGGYPTKKMFQIVDEQVRVSMFLNKQSMDIDPDRCILLLTEDVYKYDKLNELIICVFNLVLPFKFTFALDKKFWPSFTIKSCAYIKLPRNMHMKSEMFAMTYTEFNGCFRNNTIYCSINSSKIGKTAGAITVNSQEESAKMSLWLMGLMMLALLKPH